MSNAQSPRCLLKGGPCVCLKKIPTKRGGQLWVGISSLLIVQIEQFKQP